MKSEITNKTREELERIVQLDFCRHVGEPYLGPHRPIKSWEAAEKKNASSNWFRLVNACRNRLSVELKKVDERYRSGDESREELRRLVLPRLDRLSVRVAENTRSMSWPAEIRIPLFYAVLEYHYRSVVPPFFFYPIMLPIFESGRIPCGWTGKRPSIQIEQGDFSSIPEGEFFIY